jgi:4-hydroxy-4-methyl-2-oxoglutarate aldolase
MAMNDRQSQIAGSMLERIRDRLVTGVVTDALTRMGLDGWMDNVLPMRSDSIVIGPAYTVRFAPRRGADGLSKTLYQIIRECKPGDVLVIEALGTKTSVFGNNIARTGDVHGLAGIVTDGRCRDYGESAALRMGVFCAGPTVRLPNDLEIVAQNVPITCGGAQVNPGDLIVADVDGVCVIPSSKIELALIEIEEILGIEDEIRKVIDAKAPVSEIQTLLKRKKIRKTTAS